MGNNEKPGDDEETIIGIIYNELENGSDLKTIQKEIAKSLRSELNSFDESFILNECITISLYVWNQQSIKRLNKISNSSEKDKIQTILNSFKNVKGFCDVSPTFRKPKHFSFLITNQRFIDSRLEEKYLRDLRKYALILVAKLSTSAKLELKFLNLLLELFRGSYEKVSKFSSSFINRPINFKAIINSALNLTSDNSLDDLKEVAKALSSAREYILEDDVTKIIKQCIRPPIIRKDETDGRCIVEVSGKYILLSTIKNEVEDLLKADSVIQEVRFVGIDVLYIDSDLGCNIWHGKNVVVYANQVKVKTVVNWDLSGRDSGFMYEEIAPTLTNGEGDDGKDGFAGESGGNFLILAENIHESKKWTITSNGGKGSSGQGGGNGKDGEDGKGMSRKRFEDFRNARKRPSKYFNGHSIETEERSNEWYQLFETSDGFRVHHIHDQGYYVLYLYVHNLSLVEGTKGVAGGIGGAAGYGGEGGFGGEIRISFENSNCQKVNADGGEGKAGTPGLDGLKGCDGYDIGSYSTVLEGVTFYGTDQESKFKLDQFSNRDGNRVHDARYTGNKYCYSGIVANGDVIKKKISNKVRSCKKLNRNKHQQAKAVWKKPTTASQITQAYSELFKEFSVFNEDVSSLARNQGDLNELAELQNAEVEEAVTMHEKHRYKHSVLFNETSFSTRRRCKVEEPDESCQVSPMSFDTFLTRMKEERVETKEFLSYIFSLELSRDELVSLKPYWRKLMDNSNIESAGAVKPDVLLTVADMYLKLFVNNTTLRNKKMKTFLNNHAEFSKTNKIFTDVFENELMRNNADLLPLWVKSLEKAWMMPNFEEKVASKKVLNAFYMRMKKFRKKEEKLVSVLRDNEVWGSLRSFALRRFPSYVFKLFRFFKTQHFVERVLFEKQKTAWLKWINSEIQRKMRSQLNKKPQDLNLLRQVPLSYDRTSHTSLGKIGNYFIKNSYKNRTKIADYLKETFTIYNESSQALKSTSVYKDFVKTSQNASLSSKLFKSLRKEKTLYLRNLRMRIEETKEFGKINYVTKVLLHPVLVFLMDSADTDETLFAFKKELLRFDNLELSLETIAPDFMAEQQLTDIAQLFEKKLFSRLSQCIFKQAMSSNRVQELLLEDIIVHGVESRFCRNVLAAFYDLNIQVYRSRDDSNFEFVENFNSNGAETFRILALGDDEYGLLEPDTELQGLHNSRNAISNVYRNILADFDNLTTSFDLDNYIAKKVYLKQFETTVITAAKQSPTTVYEEKRRWRKKGSCLFEDVLREIYFDAKKDLKKDIETLSSKPRIPSTHETNIELFKEIAQVPDGKLSAELISGFFRTHKEISFLYQKLQLLSFEVKGSEILRAVVLCLQNDGVHISFEELSVMLDIILTCSYADYNLDTSIAIWTVLSQSQTNWCIQFVVFEIENVLKARESHNEYFIALQNVKSKKVLTLFAQKLLLHEEKLTKTQLKAIVASLEMMSSSSLNQLSSLKLSSWKYVATEDYFRNKLSQLEGASEKTLKKLEFFVMQMQNVLGSKPVGSLIDVLVEKRSSFDKLNLIAIFQNFYLNEWNLSEETIRILRCNPTEDWAEILNKKFACSAGERKTSDLIKIIKNNPNVPDSLKNDLDDIKKSIEETYGYKFSQMTREDIKHWRHNFKQAHARLEETLAVVIKAILIITGNKVKLRPTQLLTIIALLRDKRNVLAQVSTGEGKSWIAVAIAIVNGLRGQNLDIITSSKVLAERDATKPEHKEVFDLFKISVGHNCSENDSTRRCAYSSCSVIYGDLASFQRDYLLNTFHNKNIFGDKKLDNVLIDEVDSMLLDKGNQIGLRYLSIY